jgi:flavin reductase (DIM6/NTAB) family NADH-FMN oxidoreductase RutF
MRIAYKKNIGVKNCLYPLPTTLVGANVDGKPNFITIAHASIIGMKIISVSMSKSHYTNAGIAENKTFSVNIPSAEMVKETDYCRLVSGKNTDKSALFQTFYGKLKTAPMITTCPASMECKLIQTLDFPTHTVFIGEIVSTYWDDTVLTNGSPVAKKIHPILFTMHDTGYWTMGEKIAAAWDVGKELWKKNES